MVAFCGVLSYNIITPQKGGGASVGDKKIGRPTDNPKDITIKFRIDKDTHEKLHECSETLKISRAEVLRQGVHKIHDSLKH